MKKLFPAALFCLALVGCEGDEGQAYVQTVQASQAGIISIVIDQEDTVLGDDESDTTQLSVSAESSTQGTLNYSNSVSWSSSDTSVAEVSDSGLVTPVGVGDTTVTASFAQFSDSISVSISDAELQSITLSPAIVELNECLGSTVTATGSYDDDTSRPLTLLSWSSSDARVASVVAVEADQATLFTYNSGTATLTATRNGINATVNVTATETLTAIELSPLNVELQVGSNGTIVATGSYNDSTTADISEAASWSIPAAAHAEYVSLNNTYPNKGAITADAVGTALISVDCGGV
ncbi:MAG: Ig-like domain-containing protein, partial [Granulosicoccaceae bacterium]